MKRVILIPLMMTSVLSGCQDQTRVSSKEAIQAEAQIPQWGGDYQGTTPCMGCLSRCEDCQGMAVSLSLHEDQTYTLYRESMSGNNEVETIKGHLRFDSKDANKVELLQVTKRNLLFIDLESQVLEIREDQTGKRYQMQSDFILAREV
ncbi:copper resistance protein NlpE N-terminal domain-containing protein [Acinetobacter wanghuae]|uniref:copper resistance protein NlpE N-terminal domain-containing protein n=1 Tax=Acinetobacter wanghuae TaxID=2662362 RepID=UPI003AF62500